jgi:hypothetical protein
MNRAIQQQADTDVLTHRLKCECGYIKSTKEKTALKLAVKLHAKSCEKLRTALDYKGGINGIVGTRTIRDFTMGKLKKTTKEEINKQY